MPAEFIRWLCGAAWMHAASSAAQMGCMQLLLLLSLDACSFSAAAALQSAVIAASGKSTDASAPPPHPRCLVHDAMYISSQMAMQRSYSTC